MKEYLSSSAKSSTSTTTTMEETETRDSCYYPGCRKDANCNCEICLASINATLDLMPMSSLTKLSVSKRNVERTPVSFDPLIMSTPTSISRRVMDSPALKSTARATMKEKEEKKKREEAFGGVLLRIILLLSFVFGVEFGFSSMVSGVLKPVLTKDIVKSVGERSFIGRDLHGRFRFLQNELKGFLANGKISNCSQIDSEWEINQDGLFLNSRCVLSKSATEEVSIWGWPLQTAGLLTTGFSSKSFTILSGRITEWSNGNARYSIRKANTSWVQRRCSGSVMQLDPNTWVLEYRRSSILDNSSLFSAALELLKHRMSTVVRRMNEEFWVFSALRNQYRLLAAKQPSKIPT